MVPYILSLLPDVLWQLVLGFWRLGFLVFGSWFLVIWFIVSSTCFSCLLFPGPCPYFLANGGWFLVLGLFVPSNWFSCSVFLATGFLAFGSWYLVHSFFPPWLLVFFFLFSGATVLKLPGLTGCRESSFRKFL